MNRKNAFIDTDFLWHITQTSNISNKKIFIQELLEHLNTKAHIHELVVKNEISDILVPHAVTVMVLELVDKGIISNMTLSEIFNGDPTKEQYYRDLFEEFYNFVNCEKATLRDCLLDWKKNHNLGELHTITSCVMLKYDMFFSDDKGSAEIAEYAMQKSAHKINVHNRESIHERLKSMGINRLAGSKIKYLKAKSF